MTARIGVVGATGYVGAELVRWLLRHEGVELATVVSTSRAGERLDAAVPGLLGCTDLVLAPFDPAALSELDAVLLATPHGAAAPLARQLGDVPVLLDLSADHRHAKGWVYGQPEWLGEAIRGARRVAVPGCFATAIALALAPLVAADAIRGPVRVVAATGSTGSGAAASAATHHPERFANLKAYKVLRHQHAPEVRAFLGLLGRAPDLLFVPLSAPVDRGILATCFATVGDLDPEALFADRYAASPLVRIREETPELRLVRGTAFCDLSVHRQGDEAVVLSAIDNLGRGAAAQAVQCLELALGLAPSSSLRMPGSLP